MRYVITEEERDKAIDAVETLDKGKGLTLEDASPSKIAFLYLKEYIKALFSEDTWIEARRQEFLDSLPRDTPGEQHETIYQE